MSFQVAYDDQSAYFRATWKTRNPYPGEAHPFVRFDGKEWKTYGYPKLDAVVQKGEQPGIYEDRFSIMIDDGGVPAFANQGCWLTCHNGERDMPKFATRAEVQANPLYQALKQNDARPPGVVPGHGRLRRQGRHRSDPAQIGTGSPSGY